MTLGAAPRRRRFPADHKRIALLLCSDENGFDPMRVEETGNRPWKRTPVRPR